MPTTGPTLQVRQAVERRVRPAGTFVSDRGAACGSASKTFGIRDDTAFIVAVHGPSHVARRDARSPLEAAHARQGWPAAIPERSRGTPSFEEEHKRAAFTNPSPFIAAHRRELAADATRAVVFTGRASDARRNGIVT